MIELTYQKNFSSPVEKLTKDIFNEILDGTYTKVNCRQIEDTDDEERKNAFKRNLRSIIWQTSEFKGDKRVKKDVVTPSYLCCVDIDHYDGDPRELYDNLLPKLKEEGMVGAHISARGHGLHLILPVPADIEVELTEAGRGVYLALLYYSLFLGIDVDMQCQDLSRASFTPWRKSFLYLDEEVLFGEKELVRPKADPEILAKILSPTEGTTAETATAEPGPVQPAAQPDSTAEKKEYPADYQGIPLALIDECLDELMGGMPAEGSRNAHIYAKVGFMRYLRDDNEDWIMADLATKDFYGLTEQEARRTVKSALSKAIVSKMPKTLERAIEMARMRHIGNDEEQKPMLPEFEENPPQMPEDKPFIIKHLCKNVHEDFRPALANGLFAPLNAHLHNVRVKTVVNRFREPRFFHIIIGKSGIGKSFIEEAIEAILSDLRAHDREAEERLKEWYNADKVKGANDQKELKPEDAIHCPIFDLTAAAVAELLVNNEQNGHWPAYLNLPELKLLRKLDPKGGDGVFLDLGYDSQLWGQKRLTSQGYTGQAQIRLDFNASSTIANVQDYFKGNMADGKFNRCSFSTILREDEYSLVEIADYDKDFTDVLKPYLNLLKNANGDLECKEAIDMAKALFQEAADYGRATDDSEHFGISKRAIEITTWKAYILWIMNGQEWSKEIEDFCVWAYHYDMWCKLHYFGTQLHEAMKKEVVSKRRGPKSETLNLCPDSFTKEDVENARKMNGSDPSKYMTDIYNWKFKGFIEEDGNRFVKTQKWFDHLHK